MIKGVGSTGSGDPLIVIGLSAENIRRLMGGEPILTEVPLAPARLLTARRVHMLVVGGLTENDIAAELRKVGMVQVDGEPQ